jgi:hypothetical protein
MRVRQRWLAPRPRSDRRRPRPPRQRDSASGAWTVTMSPSRYTGLAGPIPVSRSMCSRSAVRSPTRRVRAAAAGTPGGGCRRLRSGPRPAACPVVERSRPVLAQASVLARPAAATMPLKAAPSLDRGAAGAQEHLGLAQAVQVGGDGTVGAVLGTHVRLERPSQGRSHRLVHDTQQVKTVTNLGFS